MAKTASDFPVTFPFKGQDGYYYGPNGKVGLYHLGDDRAMPIVGNNPMAAIPQTVYNGSTLIGKTGVTGVTSGHHLHSEKFKPGRVSGGYYEPRLGNTYFKASNIFNSPGKVIYAGPSSTTAGTYVRWRGDDGYTYGQFHLSSVNVKVGQVLKPKEDDMLTATQQDNLYRYYLGRAPHESARQNVGKVTYSQERDRIKAKSEYKDIPAKIKAGTHSVKSHLPPSLQEKI